MLHAKVLQTKPLLSQQFHAAISCSHLQGQRAINANVVLPPPHARRQLSTCAHELLTTHHTYPRTPCARCRQERGSGGVRRDPCSSHAARCGSSMRGMGCAMDLGGHASGRVQCVSMGEAVRLALAVVMAVAAQAVRLRFGTWVWTGLAFLGDSCESGT